MRRLLLMVTVLSVFAGPAWSRDISLDGKGAKPTGVALVKEEIGAKAANILRFEAHVGRLVATDLSKASAEEKRFTSFVIKAAELIEKLYAKQEGVTELAAKVPADDPASKSTFPAVRSAVWA